MYSSETYHWYISDYGRYNYLSVSGAFRVGYGVNSSSMYSYEDTQFLAVF